MFLKTAQLKKMMKNALKGVGLYVGNIEGSYVVWGSGWGLDTDAGLASNKFKAALTELIGDIPETGKMSRFYMTEKNVTQEAATYSDRAYDAWKAAKDYAVGTPLSLFLWPHEYVIYQVHSDHGYLMVNRALTWDLITGKELEPDVESMPGRPSCAGSRLYWKNDTTIYWADAQRAPEKVRDVLLPSLSSMNFFQSDWLFGKEASEVANETTDTEEPLLPFA